jgi:nucleoside-diphosphate-sugar epimerase
MEGRSLRVAVTGGSGRIGSVVIAQLLERGHQVINLDRRQAEQPRARFVYVDLRNRGALQPVLEQVDVVCHLGEIPTAHGPFSPEEIYAHNTAVGSTVLQTAADLGLKRVIYTSTCQVYGAWGHGPQVKPPRSLPMDETLPVNPQNVYALSKVANETYARLLAEQKGLSVAAFRFPWVVTEMPNERWYRMLDNASGPLEGMGTYVHVNDAAKAFALAVENLRPGFEAYHFTADDVWTPVPLRARLLATQPDFPALPVDWPDYKSPVICDKAKAHFGWQPTFGIREGFERWKAEQAAR